MVNDKFIPDYKELKANLEVLNDALGEIEKWSTSNKNKYHFLVHLVRTAVDGLIEEFERSLKYEENHGILSNQN